jgi:hypothetical protein
MLNAVDHAFSPPVRHIRLAAENNMEDDELADRAQQLLDALDALLRNTKLFGQLSQDDRRSIELHRHKVLIALQFYRQVSYFTKRRSPQARMISAGPRQAVGSAAVLAIPLVAPAIPLVAPAGVGGGAAAATGTGRGIALVVGEFLLPIAIAVSAAVFVSDITGGSIQDIAARKLIDAATELTRDLLELGELSVIMALTAAEAEALSTEELLEKLIVAAGAVQAAAMAIILEVLIKRYPGCIDAIKRYREAVVRLNMLKRGSGIGGTGRNLVPGGIGAVKRALDALRSCVGLR